MTKPADCPPNKQMGNGKHARAKTRSAAAREATLDLFKMHTDSLTIQRLLMAGVDCFSKNGFHASNTRDIAKRAKLSPAAVYVHFKSKNELLFTIIQIIAGHLLEQLRRVDAEGGDPKTRLWRIVQQSVAFPASVHKAATVVNSQFIALDPEQRKYLIIIRDDIDCIFEHCLREGCEDGAFEVKDISIVKTAIVTLCRSVLTWYSPKGRFSPEELGSQYADLVISMIEVRG